MMAWSRADAWSLGLSGSRWSSGVPRVGSRLPAICPLPWARQSQFAPVCGGRSCLTAGHYSNPQAVCLAVMPPVAPWHRRPQANSGSYFIGKGNNTFIKRNQRLVALVNKGALKHTQQPNCPRFLTAIKGRFLRS